MHGKSMPPKEAAKTLAEEQAAARPDRLPYEGVLSLVTHEHDVDYDEVSTRIYTLRHCGAS